MNKITNLPIILFSLAPIAAQGSDSATTVVKATRIVIAPDTVLENGAFLIRDGKIALIGSEIPKGASRGAQILDFSGKTVVPGFVNPHSHLGLGLDLAESVTAVTPDLKATDAFDPFDEILLDNARGGVTTIGLAPLSMNAFAGIAGVIKTGEMGKVLAEHSYLKIALVQESLNQNRYPTSHMGAMELIRTNFKDAKETIAAPTPESRVLRDVLAGSLPVAIHAHTHAEIEQALELCQQIGAVPLLIDAAEAEHSIAQIAKLGGSVILAPLSPNDRTRTLELPAKLEEAGIPFSFMSTVAASTKKPAAPSSRSRGRPPGGFSFFVPTPASSGKAPVDIPPDQLRLSVALAVRHGLSRQGGIAALTRIPAEQCGVSTKCGSLRQGCDADFLVFSGEPTDLTSRLEAVYLAGRAIEEEENK